MEKIISKSKLKRAWGVATINFKNIKLAYILPVSFFAATIISMIINLILNDGDNSSIEINFFYGIILLAPIFIPAKNFKKTVSLNIKKKDYFLGTLINYIILSVIISLIVTILYYALAQPITQNTTYDMASFALYKVFGWKANGVFVGFLQQFGFLFFCCVFIHTLTSVQDKWLGWVIDCIIIAIIPVFSSIAVLRQYGWGSIFYVLIFGHPAIQILFTVLGGIALYCINLTVLKKKEIR